MIEVEVESREHRCRAQLERLRQGADMVVRGEIEQMESITALCSAHGVDDPDEIDPFERMVSSGRDGTPSVSEFCCLEVGAMLGLSPENAAGLIWSTLDLVHRHLVMHQQVREGRVRFWQARRITGASSHLSCEAAQWVDRQISPALGRFSFGRVMPMVTGLVAKADPALAAERADQQRRAREVKVQHEAGFGVSRLFATLDHTDAIMLDSVCTLPTPTRFPSAFAGQSSGARRTTPSRSGAGKPAPATSTTWCPTTRSGHRGRPPSATSPRWAAAHTGPRPADDGATDSPRAGTTTGEVRSATTT
ncbi:hypothetical protein [Aestuariimicrobium ganziense]|uniref:hypothetical protein n=1 Tax=Aestuariimicrobium ganziense TaxID=2773677 RepID=UPI0019418D42|nr:hypothetical protein [Aestuariimicrobium ganziense]